MNAWVMPPPLAMLAQALSGRPDSDRRHPDRDAALIERCRGGDPGAFRELYQRHVDVVYQRLTRILGPVPEREDLTQEIFLALHNALPRFRGEAALSTLIYRIVVNVAYEHLRRQSRRPRSAAAVDDLVALADPGLGPEAAARQREQVERVLQCAARIKPKKRIALMMRVVDGMSLDEIAEVVDASAETVAKRVQHGMKELMALLERAESGGAP
jgi:RNA polymerase sigma-70 factor, ECF subfamily